MNIFALDKHPKNAAEYLGNGHVNKMIVESVQLLSSAYYFEDFEKAKEYNNQGLIYKLTHQNHPCSKWVRESRGNFLWLYYYIKFLEIERQKILTYKNKPYKPHKSYEVFINMPFYNHMGEDITPFTIAISDVEIKERYKDNPVQAYREYYKKHKRKMATYEGRIVPFWWE